MMRIGARNPCSRNWSICDWLRIFGIGAPLLTLPIYPMAAAKRNRADNVRHRLFRRRARIDSPAGHPHTLRLSCPMLRGARLEPACRCEESGDDARSRHDPPAPDGGSEYRAAGGTTTTITRVLVARSDFRKSIRAGESS